MACPEDMRIWISELEGFITSPSSSVKNEDEDELERNPYVLEAIQITKEEDELGCFKPSFVTIGPLHFDRCDRGYDKGNALKMEALRFIMKHDKQAVADNNAPPWQLQDGQDWKGVFNEIVNKIGGMEDRIRDCYREGGRRIPSFLVDRGFGWMILVDACFILVALYMFQSKPVKKIINSNNREWPCLHFLTRGGEDATLRMILRDMVVLENQLPSWVLKEVADMLHIPYFPSEDYCRGCQELVRLMLGMNNGLYLHLDRVAYYNKPFHLPYIVRSRIVDLVSSDLEFDQRSRSRRLLLLTRRISHYFRRLFQFELLRSTQPLTRQMFRYFPDLLRIGLGWLTDNIGYIVKGEIMAEILSLAIGLMLIILMLPAIMIIAMVMVIVLMPSFIIAYFWPNPILTSAGRLRPQGFLRYFPDEERWNLILRNVIALERCSPYMMKTVSNYVFLMAEILETQQDVEALQAIGLVPKTVNSKREVGRWKSLATSAKVHGRPYADFDDPISVFRREFPSRKEPSKLWIMWWTWELWVVDLKKTYVSSPWIAFSTLAAIALLFMTGAQVICLFISCNKP